MRPPPGWCCCRSLLDRLGLLGAQAPALAADPHRVAQVVVVVGGGGSAEMAVADDIFRAASSTAVAASTPSSVVADALA